MFYIDPDGKTVHEAVIHKDGIILGNGRIVAEKDIGGRIFAVHPDVNTYMCKEDDGTYSFLDPYSKRLNGNKRKFFRPDTAAERATVCKTCGSGLLDGLHIADYPPCGGKP
jgi:hypothetical protein